MFAYIVISIFTICLMYAIQSMIKPKKFPPGPRWYPFFGCDSEIYSLTKKHGSQFEAFLELSKEYSTEVLGLNLGGEQVVVLYGEKKMKHVLLAEEYAGRPDNFIMRMRCFGKKSGLTISDGLLWKIHRKFTLTHLRNAGYGKDPMEKSIQDTSQDLVNSITRQGLQPIWPKDFLPLAVLNNLWKCAAGEKIKPEKYDFLRELLQKRRKMFNIAGGLLNRIPWSRFLLPEYTGYTVLVEVNKHISTIVEETILKHKNGEVEGHNFIYAFLQEMAENRETFTDDQLKVVCGDIILAGSEAAGHATGFAILQVLRDQEMQRKIQQEVHGVLGDNVPCWNDRLRLIYTSAFLLELHRFYAVAPLVGPRRVLKDTVIDGYVIPKNTTVLVSMADINFDPNLWEDPHVFKPERFIDDSGNLKPSEHLNPFGLGRRRCPGEVFARMFIFITITTLIQHFRISCADDHLPSNEPDVGILACAKPYRALFTPRKPKA